MSETSIRIARALERIAAVLEGRQDRPVGEDSYVDRVVFDIQAVARRLLPDDVPEIANVRMFATRAVLRRARYAHGEGDLRDRVVNLLAATTPAEFIKAVQGQSCGFGATRARQAIALVEGTP